MEIKKVPYITLDIEVERDEFAKWQFMHIEADDIHHKNIVESAVRGEKMLNVADAKYIPQKNDKIFFMKGCTVPRVKLKDLAVQYKIRTTTDIDNATVVVGSSQAGDKLFTSGWLYSIDTKLFFDALEQLSTMGHDIDSYYLNQIKDLKLICEDQEFPDVIYTDWNTQRHVMANQHSTPVDYRTWFDNYIKSSAYKKRNYTRSNDYYTLISDNNLEVFESVKSKTIINQNALLEVVNGDDSVTIDHKTYENLRNMFKSSDTENHVLAMEIMANSNYKDSILYLELLYFHHHHQIDSTRSRNHVNFKSLKSYLGKGTYYHSHIDTVIRSLNEAGVLDNRALDIIIDEQRKWFDSGGHSEFIKPKAFILEEEISQNLKLNWISEVRNYDYTEESTVDEITEEKVVEDTVDEVLNSEPVTGKLTSQENPENEKEEVETEEEVTETLITTQKEEKNEEEFDWF
tara:strand:+ start:3338 stop:4714 length:1377 start_codon:yes stop_codon:yes gene_type:complete